MSKAEQRALEAYPPKYVEQERHSKRVQSEMVDTHQPMRAIYIKGYHQAEKDLDIVSWIKKVSGVKDMSRAKEEALKAYPPRSIAANYDTINRRDAFEYGYLKAEKDVAESFSRIIRGNLSMIDEKVQVKFEQLYTDITKEKMYKGFND